MEHRIVLYTSCLLGKYAHIYGAHLMGDEATVLHYYYNDSLPIFEYLTADSKKHHILSALGCGKHPIKYKTHDMIIDVSLEILPGKELVYETHPHELISRIELSGMVTHAVLREFIEDAKKHVEDVLDGYRKKSGTISKFVYCHKREDWKKLNMSNARSFESVFLPPGKKDELIKLVNNFVDPKVRAEYDRFCIPYKCNIVLYGAPGTGKTSTVVSIASLIKSDIAVIQFTRGMDDTALSQAINSVVGLQKCKVIVMEDIDSIFIDRKEHDTDRNNITLSGLLNALDGVARVEGAIVILTTNRVSALDEALLRAGRMDYKLYYPDYMCEEQVREMFGYYFGRGEEETKTLDVFIKKIQSRLVTPAMLQQYFFNNRNDISRIPLDTADLFDLSKNIGAKSLDHTKPGGDMYL